jgi:hypothetical protein
LCCTTLMLMHPALSRTCCTPCSGRYWTISHTAQTCYHVIPYVQSWRKHLMAVDFGWMKMLRPQWCNGSSSSPGSSLQRGPISWSVNGMPVSSPMWTLLLALTPSPRAIPKWDSFEQISYNS